jgi:pyridinium-3,5-biscarboxylic acid mononucleotide sulfurtransferase
MEQSTLFEHAIVLVQPAASFDDGFMTAPEALECQTLADRLDAVVRPLRRVAIAYSGGVDSAVVAAAAARSCELAVAVTAISPSLASGELEEAKQVAARIGIRHEVIRTDEFSRPGYRENAGNRCYFCKTELYGQLVELAPKLGVDHVLNGTNLDDLGDYRPGLEAARQHRVLSPLVDAQLRKIDVRAIARIWGIPIWDKPASPCLSSRIAYGVEATPERVRRIDQAEAFLKRLLHVNTLRVRCEAGELARLELPLESLSAVMGGELRGEIAATLRSLGFRRVTIDLEGFRSGSMNDDLPLVALEASPSSRTR